jgi:Peptidase family M23
MRTWHASPIRFSLACTSVLVAVLIVLVLGSSLALSANDQVRLVPRPTPIYIERTHATQLLNFDLLATNTSAVAWTLTELEVSVLDASGKLEVRKFVSDNGNSPSVDTLNHRLVGAGQTVVIFIPFFSFDKLVDLSRLSYRARWTRANGAEETGSSLTVEPTSYRSRVPLSPPLRGRVLVWDGHDFYAHHRRFDYGSAHSVETGTYTNTDRFGHDFVPVSDAGAMYTGDPALNTLWLGFGHAICAAGAGLVVACVDDAPDDRTVDPERFRVNKLADYGNYVVVDHGGGGSALYGHLQQHSAAVTLGRKVHQGQLLARIGVSGSSLMPHLHFQLQSTANVDGEGLPTYFDSFTRMLGGRRVMARDEPMDSGDIVLMSAPNPAGH